MDKRSNADNRSLCHFSYADGRRCRMLHHRDHPGLCPFHSREERQAIESERIGTELAATLTGHFHTAADINHVLGKVFTALAQDRISVRKAATLAYAAQLMLQSIPTVKAETKFEYTYNSWQKMIDKATKLPAPTQPPDDPDSGSSSTGEASTENARADRPTTRDRHLRHVPPPQRDDSPKVESAAGAKIAAGFTPPAATQATNATDTRHGVAGAPPLRVGPSGPTDEAEQSSHLSSPHPSANPADACGDSSDLAPTNDTTNEDTNEEDADEENNEPAPVSTGPHYRHRT